MHKKHHSSHEYKHASEHGGGRNYSHHMSHHEGKKGSKACVSGEMSWTGRPEYDSHMDGHWKGADLKGMQRHLKKGGSIK